MTLLGLVAGIFFIIAFLEDDKVPAFIGAVFVMIAILILSGVNSVEKEAYARGAVDAHRGAVQVDSTTVFKVR